MTRHPSASSFSPRRFCSSATRRRRCKSRFAPATM
jgi:hypothetical protein